MAFAQNLSLPFFGAVCIAAECSIWEHMRKFAPRGSFLKKRTKKLLDVWLRLDAVQRPAGGAVSRL
jgi:hypothetical protein